MNEHALIQGIADTIQRVYGDATQTDLDHKAAKEVWTYLSERGVMPLPMVAAIVQAAGGEVTIPFDVLMDPPSELMVMDADFAGGDRTVKVRYRR